MAVRFGALLKEGGLDLEAVVADRGPLKVALCGWWTGNPYMGPNRRTDGPPPPKCSEKRFLSLLYHITPLHPPSAICPGIPSLTLCSASQPCPTCAPT